MMKFTTFAAFAILIAAAVVVDAAVLHARDTAGNAGSLCAAAGTVTIQGITQAIPPISATCSAGLSCSATKPVTSLPGLGDLLGTADALLDLLTSLPVISDLPVIGTLTGLIGSLLGGGSSDDLLGGLLGGLLNSIGSANILATVCA